MLDSFLLLTLTLAAPGDRRSPFNDYAVHLRMTSLPGPCDTNAPDFGNRTYQFRDAPMFPHDSPLRLHDGKYVERNPDGSSEWESSLGVQPIQLGHNSAFLIGIGAHHLQGSGSIEYLLVTRCDAKGLKVLFEACGALTNYSYSANEGLRVTHYEWDPDDCHACPRREVTETYRWQSPGDTFRLVSTTERPVQQR
jgi:hypothetical protein